MINGKILTAIAVSGVVLSGCKSQAPAGAHNGADNAATAKEMPLVMTETKVLDSKPLGAVLKATAFRMSGDYADKVAITIGPDGELVYYPAPTDITVNSAPVDLGNGWWLNRQGVSAGSVFTKYTFEEYAALSEVPTPTQLKAAVIPGAKVTTMMQLPYPASQAMQHLPEIKALVSAAE